MDQIPGQVHYSIWAPNGNITALAEGVTETKDRADVFAGIMKRHPEVEQVGFVRLFSGSSGQPFDVDLQMAGGEFCGNASMCAAALFLLRNSVPADSAPALVKLRVSGTSSPVSVLTRQEVDGSFASSILMPQPVNIGEREFVLGSVSGSLPIVCLEGITHIIIEPGSPFFALKNSHEEAERAVRTWCGELSSDCLGLMFLEEEVLTPLVYVPGCQTVFWEKSCASGTAAVGVLLTKRFGTPVDLTLQEPCGSLRVTVSPDLQKTRLYETIHYTSLDVPF